MFCISSFQRYTLNVSFTSYHESQPIHKTLWAMIFSTRANFQSTSSVKYMLDGCEVLLNNDNFVLEVAIGDEQMCETR